MAIASNFPAIKPSLSLDFANTKRLDSRVTFTRTTTATYYDGVTTAKAEENLLLQSQAWATTPWFVNVGGSVTAVNNAATSPDGTSTATSLTFNAQFGSQAQSVTTINGLSYTFSFWAKRISGNTALHINHFDSATGANTAFTITNDWVRYSVTVLGKSGGGSVQFGVQDRNASGFGEIQVWGAQLEQRSSVSSYTATTTQAITNYIPVLLTAASGVARFDHNPTTDESLGLLIEEARTNLLTYSADFSNAAWTKSNASITSNIIVAPDGTLTGDQLVENTSTGQHRVYRSVSGTTNTNPYTYSFFAKASTRTRVYIGILEGATFVRSGSAVFDLSTGAIVSVNTGSNGASGGSATIQNVGNGWYRCTYTLTLGGTDTSIFGDINLVSTGTTISYTGDGYSGIYIWGAQLEAGAFPTSYIATTAATVTRNADAASMTGSNFTSWYNAAEGAIYCDWVKNGTSSFQSMAMISDGVNSPYNSISLLHGSGSPNNVRFDVSVNSVSQASLTLVTGSVVGTAYKTIGAYKVNDFAGVANAGTVQTDTSGNIPLVNQLGIGNNTIGGGYLNGTIKKLAYYPLRVTNAQLQALTS